MEIQTAQEVWFDMQKSIHISDIELSIMIMALDCRRKALSKSISFLNLQKCKILQPSPPTDHPQAILTYFVPAQILVVRDAPAS
jgi:hypothetical protein